MKPHPLPAAPSARVGNRCFVAWVCALLAMSTCLRAQTVTWDGGGDGVSWHDPLNWSGDFVPGVTNDVVADVPDLVTITVANNVTVRSFQCEEALLISGGTFTVTEGVSWVDGGLTVNASRGLTVLGSNTTFTANGPTTINSAVLRAQNGAGLHLPAAAARMAAARSNSVRMPPGSSIWTRSRS